MLKFCVFIDEVNQYSKGILLDLVKVGLVVLDFFCVKVWVFID